MAVGSETAFMTPFSLFLNAYHCHRPGGHFHKGLIRQEFQESKAIAYGTIFEFKNAELNFHFIFKAQRMTIITTGLNPEANPSSHPFHSRSLNAQRTERTHALPIPCIEKNWRNAQSPPYRFPKIQLAADAANGLPCQPICLFASNQTSPFLTE